LTGLLVLASTIALPQVAAQGGKAMPLRIQFGRGRDYATLNGKLRGDQQAEYSLGARKGQKLTISLQATPQGTVTVKAMGPESNLELKPHSNQQWEAVLPDDGDYEIWVIRSTNKPGLSRYKLRVTIR
jgi:hypothetical protein